MHTLICEESGEVFSLIISACVQGSSIRQLPVFLVPRSPCFGGVLTEKLQIQPVVGIRDVGRSLVVTAYQIAPLGNDRQ